MELQALIKDLKTEKARYNENLYELQDNIRVKYPQEIKQAEVFAKHYAEDLKTANSAPKVADEDGKECYPLTIGDTVYTTRKEAGEALKNALAVNSARMAEGKEIPIGEYRGLKLSILFNDFGKKVQACLRGEKPYYTDMNVLTDIGNITRLEHTVLNIQKSINELTAKAETKKSELEQMKIDVEKPFAREDELRAALAELEEVHIKLTEFELTDDTAQKELFERCVDMFPHIMAGEVSYIQYESKSAYPLHVELDEDNLTISNTYTQNGVPRYVPCITFKVDYDNMKIIPIRYKDERCGKEEEYDIENPTPELMKRVNETLSLADDWFDDIETQGYTPVSDGDEPEQRKDDISI